MGSMSGLTELFVLWVRRIVRRVLKMAKPEQYAYPLMIVAGVATLWYLLRHDNSNSQTVVNRAAIPNTAPAAQVSNTGAPIFNIGMPAGSSGGASSNGCGCGCNGVATVPSGTPSAPANVSLVPATTPANWYSVFTGTPSFYGYDSNGMPIFGASN